MTSIAVLPNTGTPSFSPDSKFIVTVSNSSSSLRIKPKTDEYVVRVWEADSGKLIATLEGHTDRVNSARFSPDSKRVITASRDTTVRIWEVGSSKPPVILQGHGGSVDDASFSPDGKLIVTVSEKVPTLMVSHTWDMTARIWEAGSGTLVATHLGKYVRNASFGPDSKWLVSEHNDGAAEVWEASSGRTISTFSQHEGVKGPVSSKTPSIFSPDGKWVVSTGTMKSAHVWEAGSGRPIATIKGHTGAVNSASFSPDSKWIVTASDDKTVRVCRASNGHCFAILQGHTQGVNYAGFNSDGKWLITVSSDNTARVYPWEMFAPIEDVLDLAGKRYLRELTPQERAKYPPELLRSSSEGERKE